jgi:ABC-type enterochelin transport system substrate-binding protein
MKKIFFYSAIISFTFLTACDNAAKTETKTEEGKTVTEPAPSTVADTTKTTSVSVGPGGVDVKDKNTSVTVDKNGIKIGTKDVKVDVKK